MCYPDYAISYSYRSIYSETVHLPLHNYTFLPLNDFIIGIFQEQTVTSLLRPTLQLDTPVGPTISASRPFGALDTSERGFASLTVWSHLLSRFSNLTPQPFGPPSVAAFRQQQKGLIWRRWTGPPLQVLSLRLNPRGAFPTIASIIIPFSLYTHWTKSKFMMETLHASLICKDFHLLLKGRLLRVAPCIRVAPRIRRYGRASAS